MYGYGIRLRKLRIEIQQMRFYTKNMNTKSLISDLVSITCSPSAILRRHSLTKWLFQSYLLINPATFLPNPNHKLHFRSKSLFFVIIRVKFVVNMHFLRADVMNFCKEMEKKNKLMHIESVIFKCQMNSINWIWWKFV